jgi:hypothetical protein
MTAMDERTVRVLAHQRNIDRYQSLLKTNLSDVEQQYLRKRMSEERLAIEMLQFMSQATQSDGCASV